MKNLEPITITEIHHMDISPLFMDNRRKNKIIDDSFKERFSPLFSAIIHFLIKEFNLPGVKKSSYVLDVIKKLCIDEKTYNKYRVIFEKNQGNNLLPNPYYDINKIFYSNALDIITKKIYTYKYNEELIGYKNTKKSLITILDCNSKNLVNNTITEIAKTNEIALSKDEYLTTIENNHYVEYMVHINSCILDVILDTDNKSIEVINRLIQEGLKISESTNKLLYILFQKLKQS